MIAFVLAAVILQPLDAEFSTASHPKNCGLDVSLRYPASWSTAASEHALGLVDFGTTDNNVVMALWINDRDLQFPAGAERERSLPEVYRDALWSVLERFVPENCQYERAATAVNGTIPAAKIYFRSAELNGQVVGFVYERRVVMLWSMCRGSEAGRFDELKPLFQGVLDSVNVQTDRKPWPVWLLASCVIAVVAIGFAVHRQRAKGSAGFRLSRGRSAVLKNRR